MSIAHDNIDTQTTRKNHRKFVSAGCHPYVESGGGGGRKRLPKFKFSAKFPIGLHMILQIQIKKFENDCYIM